MWVPCKTLIWYGRAGRFGSRNEADALYSGKEFPTLGSAVDAAEQRALHVIHEKHPSVRRDDVDWCLVSEEVSGFHGKVDGVLAQASGEERHLSRRESLMHLE